MNSGETRRMWRVLIVDDHPVVCAGLRTLLEHEPGVEVCGDAEGVDDALRMVASRKPDLVIVDISLRAGNGLDFLKRIRVEHPEVRAIVSSMHAESDFADRALAAGALAYVGKHEPVELLLEAVRGVMRDESRWSGPQRGFPRRAPAKESSVTIGAIERLSDREIEVFEAIGRGRSTREIAASLHRSIKTIETHRENIKRKLGMVNNTELIRSAWQWLLEEPTRPS